MSIELSQTRTVGWAKATATTTLRRDLPGKGTTRSVFAVTDDFQMVFMLSAATFHIFVFALVWHKRQDASPLLPV